MNPERPNAYEQLSPEAAARVDAVCDGFEKAWRAARSGAEMPQLANFLNGCDENERTILAHGTCLDQREIQMALDAGVWFAHNPRSNMNNQVGYAPVGQFGRRSVLGTDGISGDMFEETRLAFLKGRDTLSPLGAGDWLRVLARGQRLATEAFGIELGALIPGSAADLVILNYNPPTPMTTDNLPGHLIFGMNSGLIDAVMVNGRFIVRDGHPAFDEEGLYARARETAAKLWGRYVEID